VRFVDTNKFHALNKLLNGLCNCDANFSRVNGTCHSDQYRRVETQQIASVSIITLDLQSYMLFGRWFKSLSTKKLKFCHEVFQPCLLED